MPLLVSVIIPTYNRAALIGRAVSSALAAVSPGDDVIVVDDGSTDNTPQVLEKFVGRIRYLRVPNGGAGAARNHGVREAKNALIAFLDSDDEWMPDKLDLQRALMQARPDVVFCFSDFAVRDHIGRESHGYLSRWHKDLRNWNEILGRGFPYSSTALLPEGREDFSVHVGNLYGLLMEASYVSVITLIVRHDLAAEAALFPEDLPIYEDWEYIGRLGRAGQAAYLDCETAWNLGHDGLRLTDADDFRSATARITMLKRVWGNDHAFLGEHGNSYHRVLTEQHLIKAKWLIRHGRTREARAELRLAGRKPLSHRVLAAMPGPIARNIVRARDALKRNERRE